MTETTQKPPVVVPRWLVRTIWVAHRTAYSITRGRFGLRPATDDAVGDAATQDGRAPER